MITNADLTLYSYNNGAYTRRVIKGVLWEECQQSNTIKTGLVNADKVSVYIPFGNYGKLDFTTSKDIIIRGIVDVEVDTSSQQTISQSLKELFKLGAFTVTVADFKDQGSKKMWHYELGAK